MTPFAQVIVAAGLPKPEPEYKFHPTRKWRFDLAFPLQKVSVEIEGGAWLKGGGRHNRGKGFSKDIEKYAEALCLGWKVLRVTPEMIKDGRALAWLERILS